MKNNSSYNRVHIKRNKLISSFLFTFVRILLISVIGELLSNKLPNLIALFAIFLPYDCMYCLIVSMVAPPVDIRQKLCEWCLIQDAKTPDTHYEYLGFSYTEV